MCARNIPPEGKTSDRHRTCLTAIGQWKNASLRSIDVNQSPRLTIESRVRVPIKLNLYFLTVEQGNLCVYFFGQDLVILFSNGHGLNWNDPLSVFD